MMGLTLFRGQKTKYLRDAALPAPGWWENPSAMGLTYFGWAGCLIIRYLRPYFIRVGWITNSCVILRYSLRGGNPPMMGFTRSG